MKKTVMVTGNLGYIGSVMVPMLTQKGYEVVGYDVGYYEDCYLTENKQQLKKQIKKDLRDSCVEDFDGIDYVIHLAGLSNDPIGDLDETLTYDINHKATMQIATFAKQAKVGRFVYASSQSIYGVSDVTKMVDEDGEKNPITAYAKSKWKCECELKELCDDEFVLTYLRPATAYGASPNLRCDIVFNAFMGYAFTSKKIEVKSDGTPWRPMSHIIDISKAFIAVLEAPIELVKNEAFNVGTADNNYTVKELAAASQKIISGCDLLFTNEHTDPRSYRVSADKIMTVLKQYYQPEWNISKGGEELLGYYEDVSFNEELFIGEKCNRLKCLKNKMSKNIIDDQLRVKGV